MKNVTVTWILIQNVDHATCNTKKKSTSDNGIPIIHSQPHSQIFTMDSFITHVPIPLTPHDQIKYVFGDSGPIPLRSYDCEILSLMLLPLNSSVEGGSSKDTRKKTKSSA